MGFLVYRLCAGRGLKGWLVDAIWRLVDRALDAAARNRMLIIAAVGIGLARTFHGWQLGAGRMVPAVFDPHLMIDAGEMLVFIVLATVSVFRGPLCKRSWPLLAGLGSLVFATFAVNSGGDGALAAVLNASAYFCAGAAYALLLMVWLEVCGCMAPLQATLAFAGSYAVSLMGWLLLRPVAEVPAHGGSVLLCLACALLVVQAYRLMPVADLPVFSESRARGVRRTLSISMLAWIALMSFAYGFGDCFTQMGFSTLASKIGMVVPLVVIVAALRFLRDGVDIRMVYRMSLVLMAVGVVPTVLFNVLPSMSQVLMSAAQAGNMIVACMVACTSARRRRESAVFACGVLFAVDLAAILLGNLFGAVFIRVCFALSEPMARVAGTAIVMVVVLLAAYLMHDEDLSSFVSDALPRLVPAHGHSGDVSGEMSGCQGPSTRPAVAGENDRIVQALGRLRAAAMAGDAPEVMDARLEVAELAGLSRRETAVYQLMVDGKNAAVIGEELFIAQGTVRAHMSRVYEKLGVHSREEFGRLFEGQDGATAPAPFVQRFRP